ncbi:hypothetical protein M408DRAFT_329473 [Serendipita vermifera MAFF 305830]|uniref:Uncharacterized protein n=1 Tax=Serendipita vermifera MAFF 305830 TaxID=933852 RepID=A0A0C3B8E2_SERVB|nr:hypothetical protein M408DRAFT_329473 [Serendipita vermifera MAFF 305830]
MSQDPESEGDSIIVGQWTQAGHNLTHYFNSLISQINLVQNDINTANARLREERNHHRDQCKEANKKYIELAGIRLILEQKVLRLEEAVSLLSRERDQMAENLGVADKSRKQLRESLRGAGHQYERLIEDLSKSEADLFTMKQRYTALAVAYREATGEEPPAFQTSTEEEDIPETHSQQQMHVATTQQPKSRRNGGEEEDASLISVAGAPVWSYFDPTKFTSSQEELRRKLSPSRQTRSAHSERPGRGGKLLFVEEPVIKPTIVPTPPVLSLDSAAIMTPPARKERSIKPKPSSSNPTSYHSKSGQSSNSKAYAPHEYPAAQASTSSSQQATTISPQNLPERLPTSRSVQSTTATTKKPSSTNHAPIGHESALVRKHVNNANARRKVAATVDHADAASNSRATKMREELRVRKAEHRQFVEERTKALQLEMGVDLGDFPPPGVPPLKSRWTTVQVGEPKYAPRYVTPDPIVKREEEDVQLSNEDPNAAPKSTRRPAKAHLPQDSLDAREYEGEEEQTSEEEDEAYYQEFIPSRSGSYEDEDVDKDGYVQQQFDDYDYAPIPKVEAVPATIEASSRSLKSKYGDRHDHPEEDPADEDRETRPAKRRRMATQEPVPSQTRTAQNPPVRRSSARLVERRINTAGQPQQRQHQPQHQPQQRQASQPRQNGASAASRKTPQRRVVVTAKGVRGTAAVPVTKVDVPQRRTEAQKMRDISEASEEEVVREVRRGIYVISKQKVAVSEEERLDDDPIADDLPPIRSKNRARSKLTHARPG